jgi:hypothetical protein
MRHVVIHLDYSGTLNNPKIFSLTAISFNENFKIVNELVYLVDTKEEQINKEVEKFKLETILVDEVEFNEVNEFNSFEESDNLNKSNFLLKREYESNLKKLLWKLKTRIEIEDIIWGDNYGMDIAMLSSIYNKFGIKTPWMLRNVRCYKTLKGVLTHVKVKHAIINNNTLERTYIQTYHLIQLLEEINKLKGIGLNTKVSVSSTNTIANIKEL